MNYFKTILVLSVALLLSCTTRPAEELVLLHTNDTHSHVEPLSSGVNEGLGGYQRIANYIASVREKHPNVLLVDAGDFNQGSPYYTIFEGEVEVNAFNALGYDVGTLGNHEFDDGQESLAKRLRKLNYPVVCANYDFTSTPLEGIVEPYTVVKKGGRKIGFIGVLVDLQGFVAKGAIEGLHYKNPTPIVNDLAKMLKEKQKCDLVIVLSHLGYTSRSANRTSDIELARESKGVDIIVGGHSHTFLKEPTLVENSVGKNVIVTQTGALGVYVGRLDISF